MTARPIVLIGANGQLGSDLARELPLTNRPVLALTRAEADIRDHGRVAGLLQDAGPDVVVNTAAFHKVEACETDPDQAFAVNCLAVRNLALVAERLGACLVHVSTDYVFDGEADRPYAEGAAPNPVNVYGTSKLAGELFVRNLCHRHLVVRSSGLFGVAGASGKGGNFVQTMLRLGREKGVVSVVTDQTLSPTFTADLAAAIRRLIEARAGGLFHVTGARSCSWNEFARAIFELAGLTVEVRPIDTAATNPTVRRPSYSVLENRRLEAEGFGLLRRWRDALADYLDRAGVTKETIAAS